jgi:hypothetical protein
MGLSMRGLGLNIHLNDGTGVTYSPEINIFQNLNAKLDKLTSFMLSSGESKMLGKIKLIQLNRDAYIKSNSFGFYLFNEYDHSTSFSRYNGHSWNYSDAVRTSFTWFPIGFQKGTSANFNYQFNDYYYENNGYGFYYSGKAFGKANVLMDYFVEKEGSYNVRDIFIGMPFSNYDNFNVTGEGALGGFKAIQRKIGHFRANGGKNKTFIGSLGLELGVGENIGLGLDIGIGRQKTTLEDWGEIVGYGEDCHFRFHNDMGGQVDYHYGNTKPIQTNIFYKIFNIKIPIPNGIVDKKILDEVPQNNPRAAYIQEWTKKEMANDEEFIENLPDGVPEDALVKFSVTNESGVTYTYGQPVFIRNETSLSVDVDNMYKQIQGNYLSFRQLPLVMYDDNEAGIKKYVIKGDELIGENLKTVLGEVKSDAYAVIYLLTSITGTDYVDVDLDGIPSEKDFGSWTKFNYNRLHGGNGEWYRFRSPYYGLKNDFGMLSEAKDDLGSLTSGEKEVYYLESVETKSHIAWFVTNQYTNNSDYAFENGVDSEREDGLSAPPLDLNGDPAAISSNFNKANCSRLKYLDRIELFAKDRPEKAIKTVCFGYDYSLVNNTPNSSTGRGKLTLKKLWFQYEGQQPVKISPYEFSYQYANSDQFEVGKEFFKPVDTYSEVAQNPNYESYLLDPWGNIMPYAKERKEMLIPWVYQGELPATKTEGIPDDWRSKIQSSNRTFDPAAWNLKLVSLPSGGEVHIHYEQTDYSSVQDRNVMAMVSLLPEYDNENGEFLIQPSDLGITKEQDNYLDNIIEQVDLINKTYADTKIYFKFLYSLNSSEAKIDNNVSEYIDGYASFEKATYFKPDGEDEYYIKIELSDPLPREGCIDFYSTNRQGLIPTGGNSQQYIAKYEAQIVEGANKLQEDTPDDAETNFGHNYRSFVGLARTIINDVKDDPYLMKIVSKDIFDDVRDFFHYTACNKLNPSLSFLRIPMIKAKRGGGVRVKQVLLYDKGINEGHPVIYGNKYHYVLNDGKTSSGVATNEPSLAREENPLVNYMPRKNQTMFSRLTVGEDKKQTEGPLGESLLQNASVIHSRVVVENIHTGKTGTGFAVNEYFTTKDYPFDRYYDEIKDENTDQLLSDVVGSADEKTPISRIPFKLNIPSPLLTLNFENIYMTQSFRFIMNSMNGKEKSSSVYGGSYNPNDGIQDTRDAYLVANTTYEYFEPGEKVNMLKWNDEGTHYITELKVPGKEMELASEKKKLKDATIDFSVEVDVSVSLNWPPVPFVSAVPSFEYSRSVVATHATTKVISYPAILKKTITYQDGMISEQENIAFDDATGKPLLTRTTDSYNGVDLGNGVINNAAYYSFNVPAHWVYEGMGQKASTINPNSRSNQLSSAFMNVTSYGNEQEAMPSENLITRNSDNEELTVNLSNALSASIQTYRNNWGESSWLYPKISSRYNLPDEPAILQALNRIIHPWSSYSYVRDNELLESANGTFDINNAVFNPSNIEQSDLWLRGTTISRYSPNGNPLEEYNVQGIYSSVIYDEFKGFMVPAMVASNAQYVNIHYASFEKNGFKTDSYHAHSGDRSLVVGSNDNVLGENIFVTNHLKQKGAEVYLWILEKRSNGLIFSSITNFSKVFSYKEVANIDGWKLIRVHMPADHFKVMMDNSPVSLYMKSNSPNIIADDIRFQPKDAQASCFVYDQALRLTAQFDDQHFGTFYQYNEEGKLVRKLIETERGLKTIQETEYNIPKKNKD